MSRGISTRRLHVADGFTLIEVLVALVIVAVGMSVLMGAITSSAKTVSYMQDKTFAEWVALNQIVKMRTSIKAPGQVPAVGKTNGDIDFANRKWHWAQEVVASQVPGIMRVDVKVRPKDAGSSSDDDNANWYVTVSGIIGNALGVPGQFPVKWYNDPTALTQGPGAGGTNNNPGTLSNPNGTNPGGSNSGGTNSGGTNSGGTNSGGTNPGQNPKGQP